MKNGVPFDTAHAMDEWELTAYGIVFGQLENGGKEWDWERMSFIEKN